MKLSKIINTKFDSFLYGNLPAGCRQCVKGEKLVLFVGGKCSRACWYCSLSDNRKNSPVCFANEREIKSTKELLDEVRLGSSKGCGITGGDPLVYFKETLRYSKELKKKFGEKFHIHIYLPFPLVNKERIKKLSKYVDEFRFHPGFLVGDTEMDSDILKLKLVNSIVGRKRMGVEMPMIPGREKETYSFIKSIEGIVSFVNLNEFEISDTNFEIMTKKYNLNADTYSIKDSLKVGKNILKKAKKDKLKLNIHLCSAKLKGAHQYYNRLLRRKILPYGNRTEDGTVIYFAIYANRKTKLRQIVKNVKKVTKNYYIDKVGNRIIINMDDVEAVYDEFEDSYKIARVEESPTYEREVMSFWNIGEN